MDLDEKDPAHEPEVATGLTEEETTASPQAEEVEETAESQESTPETPVEDHEIFLEGEELPPAAPKDSAAWARVRKDAADAKARAAELERKLEVLQRPAGTVDPGPEPTIEDCDYDQVVFKDRVRKWDRAVEQKKVAEAQQAEQVEAHKRTIQARMDSYGTAKAELSKKVSGYAEAEAAVIRALSADRQDALLKAVENPAQIVYTLGQRPELLGEFAKITDRDLFVAKLVKLEARVKMQKKGSSTPPPEKPVRGTGSGSAGSTDSTLEKLRDKAAKTNDYTELNKWKREQRQRASK